MSKEKIKNITTKQKYCITYSVCDSKDRFLRSGAKFIGANRKIDLSDRTELAALREMLEAEYCNRQRKEKIVIHAAERIDVEDLAERVADGKTEGTVTYVVAYCTPEALAKCVGNIKEANKVKTAVITSEPITDQKSLSDFVCKMKNNRNGYIPVTFAREAFVILSIKPETKNEKEEAA